MVPRIASPSLYMEKKVPRLLNQEYRRRVLDVKLGGNQIEYEDEDPSVRQMFEEACVKAGVKNLMEKYYKKSA